MHHLGPSATVDLILRFPAVCDGLAPSFYERFLQLASANQRRSSAVHSMLETLDSYLLVRRTNITTPQFRHVRALEMNQGKTRLAKEPFVQEKSVPSGVFLDLRMDSLPSLAPSSSSQTGP